MSENSGIANILRGKKTKVKKETFPNDLYLKAMKMVADGLVGKMFYYMDQAVLVTKVDVGKLNIYGEPTSGIEVNFLQDEKIISDFFENWEEFRTYFKTREEHEERLNAPQEQDPKTLAEHAVDLDKNIKNVRMALAVERLRATAEQYNITKTALIVTHPIKRKRKRKGKLSFKNDKK